MYSYMYFEAKRSIDPNKLGIAGIPVFNVIGELSRKLDLKSRLIVHDEQTLINQVDAKYDIIYLNIWDDDATKTYELLKKALTMLNDGGYLLMDGLFDYYEELGYWGFRAFVKARQTIHGYQYNTLWDCGYGVGVITKGEDQYATYGLGDALTMDYNAYEYFFALCMNPIDTQVFLDAIETKKPQYKYAVLTCIFDGYELVREIPNPRDDVEYVMVTDDRNITSNTWKVKYVDSFFDGMSGYAKAFYVKYHPFEFVESDNFIWIDGSIQIREDFTDEIMTPFINSDYEIMEVVNTITNQGRSELERWRENGFHGFNNEQCDIAKQLFKNEPWIDEAQVQTTIYAGKNTRLLNMVNGRTWDIMRRDSGREHDITILYMPQRGQIISKYTWNSHKTYFIDANILFCKYFDYCYHKTTHSQKAEWEELENCPVEKFLIHDIWGESENPIYPKKMPTE